MIGKGNIPLINHIKRHGLLYIIVVIFFFLGIFGGSYAVKQMSETQTLELLNYLDQFLNGLRDWNINPGAATQHAVLNNLKIIFYIWLLGLTVIGIPLVLLIVSARGFVMGFTIGFLVQQKAGQGILIALLAILPPSLINIPALIVGAACAVTFSGWLVKGRTRYDGTPLIRQLTAYCALMLLVAIVSAAAGFVEAYISPTFLKLFSSTVAMAMF